MAEVKSMGVKGGAQFYPSHINNQRRSCDVVVQEMGVDHLAGRKTDKDDAIHFFNLQPASLLDNNRTQRCVESVKIQKMVPSSSTQRKSIIEYVYDQRMR